MSGSNPFKTWRGQEQLEEPARAAQLDAHRDLVGTAQIGASATARAIGRWVTSAFSRPRESPRSSRTTNR